jgi:hypothetical protein
MSGPRGAEFSELAPKTNQGRLRNEFLTVPTTARGLESGRIFPVTPLNSFRLGQQIIFWFGIANPSQGLQTPTWITRAQIKLWWARPNQEYREPGVPNWMPIDNEIFLPGPNAGEDNNRYVWIPSPTRLDITQYQTAPPVASPARMSDSLMLDDLITMDLQDPTDAAYAANFPAPQVPSRWITFMYPAMGYALGITYERDLNELSEIDPFLLLSVTYVTGTLGGTNYQESIG